VTLALTLRATATAGLVLAAGEGRRYGGPKAPVVIEGERLVDRAVRVLREANCDPVVVVLGAWLGDVQGACVVENSDWALGMGGSLRVGLSALEATNAQRAVVTLVDLPGLTGEAVTRVADCDSTLAAASYNGRRGHPVLLAREHWNAVRESASGDRGARDYLASKGDEVALVEVADVATDIDLDEPSEVTHG
jgi:CTP:molybdopterin cytidylyltransferase MocA